MTTLDEKQMNELASMIRPEDLGKGGDPVPHSESENLFFAKLLESAQVLSAELTPIEVSEYLWVSLQSHAVSAAILADEQCVVAVRVRRLIARSVAEVNAQPAREHITTEAHANN